MPTSMKLRGLLFFGALALSACLGGDERPASRAQPSAVQAPKRERWHFVDAFNALRDRDPARRLEAVEWIGANLGAHRALALDALRAAAADDAPEVAARARQLLAQLGQ